MQKKNSEFIAQITKKIIRTLENIKINYTTISDKDKTVDNKLKIKKEKI